MDEAVDGDAAEGVAADEDEDVGVKGEEGASESNFTSQTGGDVGVERAGVGQVSAHGGEADREQQDQRAGGQEGDRGAELVAESDDDGDEADHDRQGGVEGQHGEHHVGGSHVALEALWVRSGIGCERSLQCVALVCGHRAPLLVGGDRLNGGGAAGCCPVEDGGEVLGEAALAGSAQIIGEVVVVEGIGDHGGSAQHL